MNLNYKQLFIEYSPYLYGLVIILIIDLIYDPYNS